MDVLRDWPLSDSGTGLLRFLVFFNYYREVVAHFAEISLPLYAFGREEKVLWTEKLRYSFCNLRNPVVYAPVLKLQIPKEPFVL